MAKKVLQFVITLGSGTFGQDVGDTVTLSGARSTADVINPGGESMGRCQLRVFGLSETLMNKLTTIGQINTAIRAKNTVVVSAGEQGSSLSTVFQGTILDAWAEYNGAPDVAFNIIAFAGLDALVKPVNPTSYRGSTDVASIMQTLANDMGLAFENNNVTAQLSNPYLAGTSLDKVRSVARAAGINYLIDRGTLVIWSLNGGRNVTKPTISPQTGMVGYPSLSSKGMTVTMLYNENIRLGGDMLVQSSVQMACGTWRVYNLVHNLSSEMPDGPWFTTVEAINVGQ